MVVNEIIFIEETVFLAEGFYKALKEIINELDKKNVKIYLERNTQKTIENFKQSSRIREAYIIEGFIDIIDNLRDQ